MPDEELDSASGAGGNGDDGGNAGSTGSSGAGESDDGLSFYNAEHIPEEHRETYEKGFAGVRERFGKFKSWESEREKMAKDAEYFGIISQMPGYKRFVEAEDVENLDQLMDAWEKLKTAPKPNGNGSANPYEAKFAALERELGEVKSWRQQILEDQRATVKFHNFLNDTKNYPHAKEDMNDPKIKAEVVRLTGPEHNWPLEAAYERAARDVNFKRELERRSKTPPGEAESPSSTGAGTKPKEFKNEREALLHSQRELTR